MTTGPENEVQAGAIGDLFQSIARSLELISHTPYVNDVQRAIALLTSRFKAGGKLLVFGNGGSSADALHICGELVGRFARKRPALPAIALSSNQAILTAWSNDYSFETVFSRELEALGRAGDIAWGISTSGSSPNVVSGLKRARDMGLHTIGMTGARGERLGDLCDVLMTVPLVETPRIQEVHAITYHAICAAVENALFNGE